MTLAAQWQANYIHKGSANKAIGRAVDGIIRCQSARSVSVNQMNPFGPNMVFFLSNAPRILNLSVGSGWRE